MLIHVQDNGFPKATPAAVWNATILVADDHGYHPIRRYFADLKWDGKPRLDRLFIDYFPGEVPETSGEERDSMIAYLEHVGLCFMVSAVARIRWPG